MSRDMDDRKVVDEDGEPPSAAMRDLKANSSASATSEGVRSLAAVGKDSKAKEAPIKSRTSTAKGRRKKPRDMPKRPLSAYNYFFRHERERWLEESEVAAETKAEGTLFSTMGKVIASRWRELPDHQMKQYQDMAEADMERYKAEMDHYNSAEARLRRIQEASSGIVASKLLDHQDSQETEGAIPNPNVEEHSETKIPIRMPFSVEGLRSEVFPVASEYIRPAAASARLDHERKIAPGAGLQLSEHSNISQVLRANEEALQCRALAAQQQFLRQELSSLYGPITGSTYDRLAAALPNVAGSLVEEGHMGLLPNTSFSGALQPFSSFAATYQPPGLGGWQAGGDLLGSVPNSQTLYSQLLSSYGGGLGGAVPPPATLLHRTTLGGSPSPQLVGRGGSAGRLHPPHSSSESPHDRQSPRSFYQDRYFGPE